MKWLPSSILSISRSRFHQIITNLIVLKSTRKGLLKNVQDGISRPLVSREINKAKSRWGFFLLTLYLVNLFQLPDFARWHNAKFHSRPWYSEWILAFLSASPVRFWAWKLFGPENFFGPNIFLTQPSFFLPKTYFYKKKF